MFFVLRDEDRQLAKNGVKLGAILTIVPIFIVASLWSVLLASLISDFAATGATTTPITAETARSHLSSPAKNLVAAPPHQLPSQSTVKVQGQTVCSEWCR